MDRPAHHSINLKQNSRVLAASHAWRLHAYAETVTNLLLGARLNQQAWEVLLRFQPLSIEFINPDGQTAYETSERHR